MPLQQLFGRTLAVGAAGTIAVGFAVGVAGADPRTSPGVPTPNPARPVSDLQIPAVPPALDVPDTLRSPHPADLDLPQLPPPPGVPVISVPTIDVGAPTADTRIPLPPA